MAVTINPKYIPYSKEETQAILESVEHIDDTPTIDSNNVVKSGGVAAALATRPTMAQMNTALGPLQVTEAQFNSVFYPDDSSDSSSSD